MKRIILWTLGVLAVIVIAIVLAFRFSPWPSVAVIQYAFSKGDADSSAILARHVPPGIAEQIDLAYGAGPDERLDVFYRDAVTAPQPTVVWVHGGGFIAGNKTAIAGYLKVLAGKGFTTVGVEYSTGYGSTYPRPIEQVIAALAYLDANASELRIDPQRIVLAGDSAGAQIAAQTALIVTDPDYAAEIEIAPSIDASQLQAMVLVSGAYDFLDADLEGVSGWFVRTVLWAYSGVRDFMNDPRVQLASITQHVGGEFPPTFLSSGNGDPLGPQAVALAEVLEAKGVAVDTLFFPDDLTPALPHEYQFNLDLEAGHAALDRIVGFLEAHTR